MVIIIKVLRKGFNIFLFHQSCWTKAVRLKNIAYTFFDILHCLHERRDFMWIMGIVINNKVFTIIEMNIKTSLYSLKFMDYVCNIFHRNSHLRKHSNTGKGIIKVVFSWKREGETKIVQRKICAEWFIRDISCPVSCWSVYRKC